MFEETPPKPKIHFMPAILKMNKNHYLFTVGVMLTCAMLGLFVGYFYKPDYEAEAVLITNFELVGDTNITEYLVYSQLELIRQLMFHPDMTDMVIKEEQMAGNQLTLEQLQTKTTIERRMNSTIIKVRDKNPEIAARIATNWVTAAYKRLSEAYSHALLVSEAKWMLTSIDKCLNDIKVVKTYFCKNLTLEKIDIFTAKAQEVIINEGPLSLGLTKDIQISQYQPAAIPNKPIQGTKANLIMTGAVIGLILAMIMFELPFFAMDNEVE